MIKSQLIDLRTDKAVWDKLRTEMAEAISCVGLDCETQDEARHAGLNAYNNKKRHVFDHRRTVMTGFSIYPEGGDTAYYFNLAHADSENCLPAQVVSEVLAMKPEGASWIAHNAPFEITMFQQCHGIMLKDVICSLQLAVTDHGPDEYSLPKFYEAKLTGIIPIVPDIIRNFKGFSQEDKRNLNSHQSFVLGQFVGKTTKAQWSYNGFVNNISWGYGLKQLTKSVFGFEMATFADVLGDKEHMGQLTGEEVCAYGADDAFWAVANYLFFKDKLLENNPDALITFLQRENPMIYVYAQTWIEGLRINQEEVFAQRENERQNYAELLRELKAVIRDLLPFDQEPKAELITRQDKWYPNHFQNKRNQIAAWATSPDSTDSYTQCFQISNPIGNAWAIEKGITPPKGGKLNIGHYFGMRVLLHDLLGHPLVTIGGDISTDKDARAKMVDTYKDDVSNSSTLKLKILELITKVSQTEQVMKLYLTPYTQLMDPDTSCLYSVVSSMLASRRMAARFPNPMQLAKRGESTYVRGFYLADSDDEVIISADWSSVELVEIGDMSGDPEFYEVFKDTPYGDLHTGAAVDCLKVDPRYSWLTEEEWNDHLKHDRNPLNRKLYGLDGREIGSPKSWCKLMRTEIGKGANFNYWYSGALGTVGDRLGWDTPTMWAAVERYRSRFSVAEKWRTDLIEETVRNGFITLPDGHQRVRYEATDQWFLQMRRKFADISADPAMIAFADLALPRIQGRAKNQSVNSMIQGTCATLAKQSILNINEAGDSNGFRFMLPVHDELVFSVHRDYAVEFIDIVRDKMCDHPTIIKTLPLHCTVAMGRTFKPYDKKNPAYSQIELDEAPTIEGVIGKEWEGIPLPKEVVGKTLEWMMAQ